MNANFGLIDSCEKRIRNKQERYAHVRPILTPRFIPSCTDDLMFGLARPRALDTIEAIRSNPLACDFDRTLQN